MQLPHNNTNGNDGMHSNTSSGNELSSTAPLNIQTNEEPDFSEFMWMANEDLEAFDRKVISEIDEQFGLDPGVTLGDEEEEFFQRMLDEEEERDTVYFAPKHDMGRFDSVHELSARMRGMGVTDEIAAQSNLNPHAAEFVPGQSFQNMDRMEPSLTAVHVQHHHQQQHQHQQHQHQHQQQQQHHHHQQQQHHHSIPDSAAGPLYSHSPLVSPLHVGAVNHMNATPHSQHNILINSHNAHAINNHNNRFNNPVRAQMNGHSNVRRYMPVYVPNVSVYPMMNGTPQYVHHLSNRYQHHYPDGERCNEDEGYGDN